METQFSLDATGAKSKAQYTGEFTYKIPNGKQLSAAAKKEAILNAGLDLDITMKNFHYMVAYLQASLVDFPDWWKDADYGYAMLDTNIVTEVYNKCLEFEETWTNKIWGTDGASTEANG